MSVVGWLKSFWKRKDEPSRKTLNVDENGVACHWTDRAVDIVSWDDLVQVEIRTTDDGPFIDDVYFVLRGSESVCVVPSETEGFGGLLERLQRLPGFDNEAVIRAMTCTDNAVFLCWRREGV